MISHEHKCIFIHIPKCAGTSIKYFLFPDHHIDWFEPDYEVIHGYCHDRKIFMQHATSKQLLETSLVTRGQWNNYYKFTFVRNPWDRAVSGYRWLMNDRKIQDSFANYLNKTGKFTKVLNDIGAKNYRGEHVIPQSDYFSEEGIDKLDFVGRFENFSEDIQKVLKAIDCSEGFNTHSNKSERKIHYSKYYSNTLRDKVATIYQNDIEKFKYTFEDQRTFIDRLKFKFN